ncbi:MAG: MBL fold metallo-hydrolase [Porticoccaceae bacterium]|nr:MBL fold metallo-hydrolase [Porticoccaceae bacterium]
MSLGSGSKGNATLVESANSCLLIDCGFSIAELTRRMAREDRHPDQLSAILVTHEHSDHIRGVFPLARRYSLPVYLTAGTLSEENSRSTKGVSKVRLECIDTHRGFQVDDIEVSPVAVPHDAREPVQFMFRCRGKSLGVLTDLGSVTSHVIDSYRHCDGLLVEANHDSDMLADGPYPYLLKQRVGGAWGHLNNHQAAALIGSIGTEQLQGIVIGHMSEQNNKLEKVRQEMELLLEAVPEVQYASQAEGTNWLAVD